MSDPTKRFSNRVDNYVKYRPGYPEEVLALFKEKMNLTENSVIADIGSGTGVSTKVFLENGNTVYGIEPNEAMREASKVFLQDFPKFISTDGTAEDTTLADKSIDIINASQAFHWFEPAKTLAEFRRILKEDGFVSLIWNVRQLDSTEFLREYEQFLMNFGTDYKNVTREKFDKSELDEFFQTKLEETCFSYSQKFDFEGLKGRTLSSSYVPTEENPRYKEMIDELNRLFTKYQKEDTIDFLYDTKVYYAKIN